MPSDMMRQTGQQQQQQQQQQQVRGVDLSVAARLCWQMAPGAQVLAALAKGAGEGEGQGHGQEGVQERFVEAVFSGAVAQRCSLPREYLQPLCRRIARAVVEQPDGGGAACSDALAECLAQMEVARPPSAEAGCYSCIWIPQRKEEQGEDEDEPWLAMRGWSAVPMRVVPQHNDVGLRVWSAGVVLLEFAMANPDMFRGARVLELGSGTGITALGVARACQPRVMVMTDYSTAVRTYLEHNALINSSVAEEEDVEPDTVRRDIVSGAVLGVERLDWAECTAERIRAMCAAHDPGGHTACFDIVLAADVCYDPDSLPALAHAFRQALLHSATATILMAMTVRNEDTFARLHRELGQQRLVAKNVPVPVPVHDYWCEERAAVQLFRVENREESQETVTRREQRARRGRKIRVGLRVCFLRAGPRERLSFWQDGISRRQMRQRWCEAPAERLALRHTLLRCGAWHQFAEEFDDALVVTATAAATASYVVGEGTSTISGDPNVADELALAEAVKNGHLLDCEWLCKYSAPFQKHFGHHFLPVNDIYGDVQSRPTLQLLAQCFRRGWAWGRDQLLQFDARWGQKTTPVRGPLIVCAATYAPSETAAREWIEATVQEHSMATLAPEHCCSLSLLDLVDPAANVALVEWLAARGATGSQLLWSRASSAGNLPLLEWAAEHPTTVKPYCAKADAIFAASGFNQWTGLPLQRHSPVVLAAVQGHVQVVEFLLTYLQMQDEASRQTVHERQTSAQDLLYETAKAGMRGLPVLRHLLQRSAGVSVPGAALVAAARAQCVPALELLYAHPSCGAALDGADWASGTHRANSTGASEANAYHLPVSEWLWERFQFLEEKACDMAIVRGDTHFVEWLKGCISDAHSPLPPPHGFEYTSSSVRTAACKGFVHLLPLVWRADIVLDKEDLRLCAERGHLEVLEFIAGQQPSHMCQCPPTAMRAACFRDEAPVVKWLHETQALPINNGHVESAASAGALQVLEYILSNTDLQPTDRALTQSATFGSLSTVRVLWRARANHASGDAGGDSSGISKRVAQSAFDRACSFGHLNVMRHIFREYGAKATQSTALRAIERRRLHILEFLRNQCGLTFGPLARAAVVDPQYLRQATNAPYLAARNIHAIHDYVLRHSEAEAGAEAGAEAKPHAGEETKQDNS